MFFSITRDDFASVSIIDVKADCLVGEPGFVRIDFEVGGGGLENWPNDTMRLYHAGPYGQASNRLKFLLETVSHIRLRDGCGNSAILDRLRNCCMIVLTKNTRCRATSARPFRDIDFCGITLSYRKSFCSSMWSD